MGSVHPQLRRTLAWFIARRPGGVIAGAIPYRHLNVQVFEGYADTSESGSAPRSSLNKPSPEAKTYSS